MTIVEEIRAFRDSFKGYQETCAHIWRARNDYTAPTDDLFGLEERQREQLTETLGRLEPVLRRIPGLYFQYHIAATNQVVSFFDEALSSDFENPHKGDSICFAIQALTKAVGGASRFPESQLRAFLRSSPRAFLSYSFRPENDELVGLVRGQLLAMAFDVVEGDDPRPVSVSDKVKSKIDSCDVAVVLMTKEVQTSQGWSASTWVNQEATYALGRKMVVIRLIEADVVSDGKIFGDQEYVRLERSNPAKAIVQLARMLQSVRGGGK